MKKYEYTILNIIENKKIYFKYKILLKIDVGISLKGWEIKSIRKKNINISNSYVLIKNNEMFLFESSITANNFCNEKYIKYSKNRIRKLLIHKKDIYFLLSKLKNNFLCIKPLCVYLKNDKYAKLKLGLLKKINFNNKKILCKKNKIIDFDII